MNALAKMVISLLAVVVAVAAVFPRLSRGQLIDEGLFRLPRFVEMSVIERKTAKTWTITDWAEEPSSRRCTGGDRPLWDDMVAQWYGAITDPGTWVDRQYFRMCANGHCGEYYDPDGAQVDFFGSSLFRNSLFADADVVDWGEDHLALDTSDAAMIGWHGNRFLSDGILTYAGEMAYHRPERECYVLGTEMQLGDGDLEFLHLSSCHSLSYGLWPNWWRAFGGLHLLTGFHGTMYIREEYFDNYADFGDEAFISSIADAWIDNLFDRDATETADQCPVVYGVGSSATDFLTRVATERYNHVLSDPRSTEYWGAVWIGGCRGDGVGPLPFDFNPFPIDPGELPGIPDLAPPQYVRDLVQQELPAWDASLLAPTAGGDWTKGLDFSRVLRAMAGPNATPAQVQWNDQVSMRLLAPEGKIYYANQGRAWDVHRDGAQPAVDDKTALDAVMHAAAELGLPLNELGPGRVDTQIAGAMPVNPQEANQGPVSFQMYRIVTLSRQVATANGMVPVYGSRVRAAVDHRGEIQRAKTSFPPFELATGLKLRARQDVVEAVVEEIMRRKPEKDIEIAAYVAYVADNRGQRPRVLYVPAVVVNVKTGATPFSVTAPVVRGKS